jgi:hypothetical protein
MFVGVRKASQEKRHHPLRLRGLETKEDTFSLTRWVDPREEAFMSKNRPECPLFDHNNCKEAYIPKVCALVREDKTCLKKQLRKRTTNEE